jgi:hypothetical protein
MSAMVSAHASVHSHLEMGLQALVCFRQSFALNIASTYPATSADALQLACKFGSPEACGGVFG